MKIIEFQDVATHYIFKADPSDKYLNHALMIFDNYMRQKIDDDILRMAIADSTRKPEPQKPLG